MREIRANRNFFLKLIGVSFRGQPPVRNENILLSFRQYNMNEDGSVSKSYVVHRTVLFPVSLIPVPITRAIRRNNAYEA